MHEMREISRTPGPRSGGKRSTRCVLCDNTPKGIDPVQQLSAGHPPPSLLPNKEGPGGEVHATGGPGAADIYLQLLTTYLKPPPDAGAPMACGPLRQRRGGETCFMSADRGGDCSMLC